MNLLMMMALVGSGAYLYRDHKKDKTAKCASKTAPQKEITKLEPERHLEPLRQMALVQKDEFKAFYLPVIEKINEYEALIKLPKAESKYFDLLLKALRKRRAVIFDYHSAEVNRANQPFWTLALFLAILCRYTIRLLNSVEFRNAEKKPVVPYIESINALYGTEIRVNAKTENYPPNVIYLHIIEKLVDADVLIMLSNRGMYPFLINAVTGAYHQRQLPFYTLIESVEKHVLDGKHDGDGWFKSTVELILALIENNTITKNTKDALVFESVYDLYIDRHLFWELFKTYSVFEQRVITKRDFELGMMTIYKLPTRALNHDTIQIYVPLPEMDDSGFEHFIEVTNLIALPYSVIPNYAPDVKIRTKRISVNRKTHFEEQENMLEESQVQDPVEKNANTESGGCIKQNVAKKARIENQKGLFHRSDQH